MSLKMPVVFAGHGSPMNAIMDSDYQRTWKRLGKELPKPKAILAISAHWYTAKTRYQGEENPPLIYDFYGFPKELYEVKYPVKGDLALSERVKELLLDQAILDQKWGIDHGTWSVLRSMYPEADVPIVQLSIDKHLPLEAYVAIGEKLAPLREEGIMIFGSGNIVHSFQYVNFNMSGGYPWAVAFDDYIHDAILSGNIDNVIHYERMGPEAKKAFQTLDHYAPLLYVLGASKGLKSIEVFNRSVDMGSMSMTGYVFRE